MRRSMVVNFDQTRRAEDISIAPSLIRAPRHLRFAACSEHVDPERSLQRGRTPGGFSFGLFNRVAPVRRVHDVVAGLRKIADVRNSE
jgi:hypothetical protein